MDSKQYNQLGSIGDLVSKSAEGATDCDFDFATTWANEYIEGRVSVSNASKSNIDRVVYFAEHVNTHFDGTINALHHAVLITGSDSNDTYTFKEVMKEPDFG